MKASAATTAFQSLLMSKAAKQAGDDASDHRKEALAEQAHAEAAALLSRIRTSAISTVPTLLGDSSKSGRDDATGARSDAVPSETGTSDKQADRSMPIVTYATVIKAYAAQSAQRSV